MKPKQIMLPLILLLAFIEGAVVMSLEMLGAKMMAPLWGASLMVWTAILFSAILSLAIGYFLGGMSAQKENPINRVLWIYIFASGWIALLPHITPFVMIALNDVGITAAAFLTGLTLLAFPLILLGASSPLLIQIVTSSKALTGKASGHIFAISSLGGITATFLLGFLVIPTFGITGPTIIIAIILGLIPLFLLLRKNNFYPLGLIAVFLFSSFKYGSSHDPQLIYESEGLLGQMRVTESPNLKTLHVNRIPQTIIRYNSNGYPYFEYIMALAIMSSSFPEGSKVLLNGVGGGPLLNEFRKLKFDVDAVDIDKRMEKIGKKYFGMDTRDYVRIDDARHFIRTSKNKYDIIILDIFKGEVNPSHAFTIEALEEIKLRLKESASLMVNFNGITSGENGIATRSLLKTLQEVGFNIMLLPTPGEEELRNLIILASMDKNKTYLNVDLGRLGLNPNFDIASYLIQPSAIEMSGDEVIFTDDKQQLDVLNQSSYEAWRKEIIGFIAREVEDGYGFFN
ncbi:MAG: fused MFS/spermidine synthase [Bacteroidetes bacterium]|nr:fused MFS/spermidine synthase [Bacteroidota bacterium]